jgi:hypothetical protein
VGRGENLYKYGGFERTINFQLKSLVQSKYEQKSIYQKLNYLASLTTPDYSEGGFMRGNIVELTLGDYIIDTPGIISNLTYTIPEISTWDIGLDENYEETTKQLPHLIEIDIEFKPIGNFLQRRIKTEDIIDQKKYPFIGIDV